ncbi:MAG: helix-turn-helix domain-containing protein [Opitutus sp.]|nr:helix-turn-helix domain-containing protein [Opitutus sp.]
MKAIQRGAIAPARVTAVTLNAKGRVARRAIAPETFRQRQAASYLARVGGVREQLGLSQQELADLLGISRRTLENWEQGRREPTGAAKVLLRIAASHPDVVQKAVA